MTDITLWYNHLIYLCTSNTNFNKAIIKHTFNPCLEVTFSEDRLLNVSWLFLNHKLQTRWDMSIEFSDFVHVQETLHQLKILVLNQAFYEILGVSKEQILNSMQNWKNKYHAVNCINSVDNSFQGSFLSYGGLFMNTFRHSMWIQRGVFGNFVHNFPKTRNE